MQDIEIELGWTCWTWLRKTEFLEGKAESVNPGPLRLVQVSS